jgi:iron complex outermembrane receptor protein
MSKKIKMKPSIISTILFFTLAVTGLFAQKENSLAGKVEDKDTKVAIAFAYIYIPDLHVAVLSDTNGHYQINKIPAATYQVQVSYLGYKNRSIMVNVNGTTVLDIELDNSKTELSEVVVTGNSKATEIRKTPLPITTINREYLVSNLSTNAIDAIAKVPGVSAVTTGPNVSKPYIRGLGSNRILTLFDGIRQEGQQWGDEHGIEMDKYLVDRVEVIKGPASLMYGSDALAGVVNLIPNQPSQINNLSGAFTSEYQTNNGMIGGSLFLAGNKNGLEWGGRVSKRRAADFSNRIDGRVYNTGFDETSANGFIGVHKKWGFSDLNLTLYDNLQEIPDGSRDSLTRQFTQQITEEDTIRPIVSDRELKSYNISVLHQRVQHYRAFFKNMFFFGDSRLSVNLGFQRSVRREYGHPEAPYQKTPSLFLQLNTLNYDLKYFFPEYKKWAIALGANGMYQTNDVTQGTEFVIPSFQQFDLGGFISVKKDFGRLDLSGGLRYDYRYFNNDALFIKLDPNSGFELPVTGAAANGADQLFAAYTTSFRGLSASFGLAYLLNKNWTLKANISRGYRAPNISEISANGVHPGTGYFQIGNENFKPEFSLQEDLGIAYTSKSVNAGASFFVNQVSHYIFNSKLLTAQGTDSLSTSGSIAYPTFKFQQGSVLLYGMEANLDFHLIKPLHFENTLSLIYGDNHSFKGAEKNESNRYVPFMPPLRYNGELRYDLAPNSKVLTNSFVKIQLSYTATQNRVYTNENTETPTSGFTLVNIGAGAGFKNKKGETRLNLYLFANNVFNVAYQDHQSRLKYFEQYSASPNGRLGIYNMGRNIAFKLVAPF